MSFAPPGSIQQFAQEYGLNPFQIPNSPDTGYTGADPNAPGSYLFVGPDGLVYSDPKPGQEAPGTPSAGSYQSFAQKSPPPGSAAAGASASLLNPSQIAAFAPQPFQAFGNVPTVSPVMTDPTQTQLPGVLQSFTSQNALAMQPTFQAQDLALQDSLGQRGIVNSGANTYLNNQLKQGQASTLASMNAPLTQQFASYWNQADEGNANAANTANALNAGFYNQAVTGNQNAYNAFLDRLYGSGSGFGESVLGGITGTYGPANGAPLSTLGQTPGAVGGAYENGMQSFNPASFSSGLTAIGNAFQKPQQSGWQNDAGQADMSSASFGGY